MKQFIKIAIVAALSLLPYNQAYSQQRTTRNTSAESQLIDGVAALNRGSIREANEIFRKLSEADPRNDAAHYYLGLSSLYLRDVKTAQSALKRAAELDPGNYWYKDRLAMAYSLEGEDDLTIATYEEILKDFPKKNEIYFNLVNLYLKGGQFEKALAAMDQIETVFGKTEAVTTTKYDILLRQDKPEEALKALESYNEEYSSPRVLTQLGDHAMAESRDSAALAFYQEALGLQNDYAPALLGLSEVYRIRRDYPSFFHILQGFVSNSEIIPEIKSQYLSRLFSMAFRQPDPRFLQNFRPQLDLIVDQAVDLHPADSSMLTTAGLYYSSSDRLERATDLFKRNMDAHPESVSAAATYLQMLSYRKDWEKLLAECDHAFTRFPEETAFLEMKNIAYYNTENYAGIIDNCQRVIDLAPGDTARTIPAMAMMGDMYYEMGAKKETFKLYKKVLKLDPDYVPVLNNYAYYLSLEGKQLKKAYAMSKKTIDKEPDNPTYLDTIGWILYRQGKLQEAKTYFKHAMLYGGKESATCLSHYATVLEALGETDLAKVYRSQAEAKKSEGME